MSAVIRLFEEWLDTEEIFDQDGMYDRDDVRDAFVAGWNARHDAYWETSVIPIVRYQCNKHGAFLLTETSVIPMLKDEKPNG
jgi:hypothetical protein